MKIRGPIALLAAFAYLFSIAGSVLASSIHQYSIGVELTGGTSFTAVRSTRTDATITGIPASGCSSPYSGSPIYQTEWIIFGSASNWNEMGTGHQCSGTYNYWYWGYGSSGVWHPLGEQTGITLGASHTFKIWRSGVDGQETYYFDVDSTNKGTRVTNLTGSEVQVGLESYWYQVNVVYTNSSLAYTKSDGAFTNWAGRDSTAVGSLMCGDWPADTSWEAGEGSPCL